MISYIYYFILLALSFIYLYMCIKNNSFIKMPINIAYSISFIILNVFGSYFIFFPGSSFLADFDVYSFKSSSMNIFFIILFLQTLSFIIFFPIHHYQFNHKKYFQNSNISIYKNTLFIFSLLIIFVYFLLNGLPPFFNTNFVNLSNNLIVASRSAFLEEVEYFWIFRFGFYYIPQILCSILYINYLVDHSLKNRNIFLAYLLLSILLSLSFLHKTPLVILFIQLFFVNILYRRKINFKLIGYTFLVILFGIYCLYYLSFSGQANVSFSFISSAIFQRLFAVYPLALSLVPELVNHYGFYGGATSINPLGLFDFNQVNLSHELHLLIYGFIANAPSPGIGYAYSDFGFYGVFIFIVLSNFLIFFYQYLVDSINSSTIQIIFLAYIMTKALFLSMSSIFDSLLNPTDIVLVFFMLAVYFLIKISRGELRNI